MDVKDNLQDINQHDLDEIQQIMKTDVSTLDQNKKQALKRILEDWLKRVYSYCQFDSIQQCNLQNHLFLLLQMIQISQATHLPLKNCIFNAVSQKVESIVVDAYFKKDILHCDLENPFTRSIQLKKEQAEQYYKKANIQDQDSEIETSVSESSQDNDQDFYKKSDNTKKYLRNVGGEVYCFVQGFQQHVSAVDAESMYPAQKEANNIDKNCMLKAEMMEYILQHPEEFNVQDIKFTKLIDMYAPYDQENFQIDFKDYQINEFTTLYLLGYDQKDVPNGISSTDGKFHQKKYRWQIEFMRDNIYFCFQQFYFEKKNQVVKYPFCFLRQGKDLSPKAQLLTSFRFKRRDAKKQLKQYKAQLTDENIDAEKKEWLKEQIGFWDSKQASYKLLCNSEYGVNDSEFVSVYNMFESSIVTKQSRYIIQNCRDSLQAPYLILNERMNLDVINKYNTFVQKTVSNPDVLQINVIFPQDEEIQQLVNELKKDGLTEIDILNKLKQK